MIQDKLDIVILGLSITSSWGNGHATTYRGLVRELSRMGHNILFLEKDVEWYANNRDLPDPHFCTLGLYNNLDEMKSEYASAVKNADIVIVGSYVPEGVEAGKFVQHTAEGVTAFYDIDTPVTLAKLYRKDYEYISPELISGYDLYLSFSGGPTLKKLQDEFGSPAAKPFYCSFDPELYFPEKCQYKWDLGYLGTYSEDRQPPLDKLLIQPAMQLTDKNFIVAGPQFPAAISWPGNVERIEHLSPRHHRTFYNSQRFTLNITRADMIKAGYSPSVRLFEAAACAVPIISDYWTGLDELFVPGKEILIAYSPEDTIKYLNDIPEDERKTIGEKAREKVLSNHTARHRALQLTQYYKEIKSKLRVQE